jgi:SAM-dependent methyltransferase
VPELSRRRLRETFEEVAELYDRARPGYPDALFDDLVELAGLGPGCRVLEIGCGTGKATVPLAERGFEVVAVELGAGLAAVARRNLDRFPRVEIVVSSFEDWQLPDERFDAVVAATAFHWVDPEVRVVKAAEALRPGGSLATFRHEHVAGGDEAFFAEVQACYERWDPATPPGLRLPPADEVAPDTDEIERGGRFGPATLRRYEWDVEYATAEYLDLLRTYSGHRALGPERLRTLLRCIGGLIDRRHGGRITKRYLANLCCARLLG